MHPAAIKLTTDIYEQCLKDKGYELVANTFRCPFAGSCIISRLRSCNSHNRDDAPRWSFQIDVRILFDGLDYDPAKWPVTWMFGDGPEGSYAWGLYEIADRDAAMPGQIAEGISHLTERLLAERDVTRAAFEWRIKQSKGRRDA